MILVEELHMLLYTKYESSLPCGSRQDVFKIAFLKPTFWPHYLCNQPELFEQLGRGPPKDHIFQIWLKSIEQFQRNMLT